MCEFSAWKSFVCCFTRQRLERLSNSVADNVNGRCCNYSVTTLRIKVDDNRFVNEEIMILRLVSSAANEGTQTIAVTFKLKKFL